MHWRRKWHPTPVFLPGESQGWEAWWAAVYGVAQSETTKATQQHQQQSFAPEWAFSVVRFPSLWSFKEPWSDWPHDKCSKGDTCRHRKGARWCGSYTLALIVRRRSSGSHCSILIWIWANSFIFLGLSFLPCEVGKITAQTRIVMRNKGNKTCRILGAKHGKCSIYINYYSVIINH